MNFTYRPTPISAKTAIMAILFGILVGAVLILATGNDPLEIYAALIRGACGSTFSRIQHPLDHPADLCRHGGLHRLQRRRL